MVQKGIIALLLNLSVLIGLAQESDTTQEDEVINLAMDDDYEKKWRF